jgi:hypothetical protein
MRVLAFLREGRVVKEVLSHLGLPTEVPARGSTRYPEQLPMEKPYVGERDSAPAYAAHASARAQGPPRDLSWAA